MENVPVHRIEVDVRFLGKLRTRHALVLECCLRQPQVGLEQEDNGLFISILDAHILKVLRPLTVVPGNARAAPAVGLGRGCFRLLGVVCVVLQEDFQAPERVGLRVARTCVRTSLRGQKQVCSPRLV